MRSKFQHVVNRLTPSNVYNFRSRHFVVHWNRGRTRKEVWPLFLYQFGDFSLGGVGCLFRMLIHPNSLSYII